MNLIEKLDRLLASAPQNSAAPPRAPRHAEPVSAPVPIRATPLLIPAGTPWPSPRQAAAFDLLLGERGWRTPPDIVAQLAELDIGWERLQRGIADAAASHHRRYQEHLASLAKKVAEGDPSAGAESAWTESDWREDNAELLRAYKREAKTIEAAAWQIAKPILEAKADAADAAAAELDAKAREPYDRFATPYVTPSYLLILRRYAESLRNGSRSTIGRPSAMLEGV